MKKYSLIIFVLGIFISLKSQSVDSLSVEYYENYPYAYTEGGELKGIEMDIIKEYVNWLKQKKEREFNCCL